MGDDFRSVNVPVVEVTVQEDRALVRREGTVQLSPGRNRLRIEGVAPVLVDKSITATARGDSVEVHSARVTRTRVTAEEQRPGAQARLAAQQRERTAALSTLGEEHRALQKERRALEAMIDATLAELTTDSGFGRMEPEPAHAMLDRWQARLAAVAERRSMVEQEIAVGTRALNDILRLQAATTNLDSRVTAAMLLDVHHEGSEAADVVVRVDYLVPGALWRPWHRAHLIEGEDGPRVRLQCEGCVWQATGEDWTDVRVVLSTERPSLGDKPPPLHTDALAIRKRGSTVTVETRDQTIAHAGLDDDDTPGSSAATTELPGIDDGGQLQQLEGRSKVSIPNDGRPYRVPLFEFEAPADRELLCTPERVAAVMLRTAHTNTSPHPLLAGPVDLIRNSGLVGRTSTLYVAAGERFELGWGPDPALRVDREVEYLKTSRRALRSWTTKPRRVRVKLSNLDASPCDVVVRERIAVSEIDKVEVTLDSTLPRATADSDGFLRWDLHLKGLDHNTVELEWSLVVHDDVQGAI